MGIDKKLKKLFREHYKKSCGRAFKKKFGIFKNTLRSIKQELKSNFEVEYPLYVIAEGYIDVDKSRETYEPNNRSLPISHPCATAIMCKLKTWELRKTPPPKTILHRRIFIDETLKPRKFSGLRKSLQNLTTEAKGSMLGSVIISGYKKLTDEDLTEENAIRSGFELPEFKNIVKEGYGYAWFITQVQKFSNPMKTRDKVPKFRGTVNMRITNIKPYGLNNKRKRSLVVKEIITKKRLCK